MEKKNEKYVLINRTQMLEIAREYKIFISKSTIHRWANEPGFPYPVGQNGRNLLYRETEFTSFLSKRLIQIQIEH
jgi:hypothetical protein